MHIKTFQAPNIVALLDAIRADMGPYAVLLWVRRLESERLESAELEGAAAVDHEGSGASAPQDVLNAARLALANPLVRPDRTANALQDPPVPPGRPVIPVHRTEQTNVQSAGIPESNRHPVLVLVGPPGSGKTTAAAKLALHLQKIHAGDAGIISMDCGNSRSIAFLKAEAAQNGFPFTTARSASELRNRLWRWSNRGPLVIDTPSCAPERQERVASLGDELREVRSAARVHLVLNACDTAAHCLSCVEAFKATGYRQVLLTHADSPRGKAEALSQIVTAKIPISYLGTGNGIRGSLAYPTTSALMKLLS